eukprot:12702998-Ditylum_brightwellii.AAC.1
MEVVVEVVEEMVAAATVVKVQQHRWRLPSCPSCNAGWPKNDMHFLPLHPKDAAELEEKAE